MKKFFSNIVNLFKSQQINAVDPVATFQKVVEDLDVDAIINYIESGGDINIPLKRVVTDNVDGDSYSYTVPIRALDLVKGKSEALTKLLEASGAKTQEQIAAEEEAARKAERLRLRELEKAKEEREAEEEAKREAERMVKVESYLA